MEIVFLEARVNINGKYTTLKLKYYVIPELANHQWANLLLMLYIILIYSFINTVCKCTMKLYEMEATILHSFLTRISFLLKNSLYLTKSIKQFLSSKLFQINKVCRWNKNYFKEWLILPCGNSLWWNAKFHNLYIYHENVHFTEQFKMLRI